MNPRGLDRGGARAAESAARQTLVRRARPSYWFVADTDFTAHPCGRVVAVATARPAIASVSAAAA